MSTTFLPFLYQTRTLQRLVRSPTSRQAFRSLHISPRLSKRAKAPPGSDPIPFDMPSDMRPKKAPPRGVPDENGEIETVTPAERAAFMAAFEEIAERREQPDELEETNSEPGEYSWGGQKSEYDTLYDAANIGNSQYNESGFMNINIIMSDAAKNQQNRPRNKALGTGSLLDDLKGANDPARQLSRFPPSLREVAKRALGLKSYNPKGAGEEKPILKVAQPGEPSYKVDEIAKKRLNLESLGASADDDLGKAIKHDRLRQIEHLRIENKMKACKNEADLWQVIEKEVFGLLKRLGIEGDKLQTKKKGRYASPGPQLDIEIYGPLYPMLLVTSIKLLDDQFPQTSPLALSVLPRVRELGVASYALGVTTTFYNRLLKIYWRRYGDMSSVLSHLEEMRHVGLYFDMHTGNVVSGMTSWLKEMSNGEHGEFLKATMSMPDYEIALQSRLRYWGIEIGRSIAERNSEPVS